MCNFGKAIPRVLRDYSDSLHRTLFFGTQSTIFYYSQIKILVYHILCNHLIISLTVEIMAFEDHLTIVAPVDSIMLKIKVRKNL